MDRLPLPMNIPATPALDPEPSPAEPLAEPLTPAQIDEVKKQIIETLHTCFDPEIPVNIYELGLIYDIAVEPTGAVKIHMTLTTPACPAAGSLPPEVQRKVRSVSNVTSAQVDVVWDPPWDKSRMSEAAKLQLGIDD
jgi:FeS assembly SUF system protein